MKYQLQPYSIQELGQRQNQEDSMFPLFGESTSNDRLFILCDGMGGHEKGEVASATVCETISSTILSRWTPDEPLSDDLLRQAIEDAYDALDAKDNGEVKKMGTTLTFVCFHSEGVTVAHIGDSRVYQLRPAKDGNPARIVFRTQDHSLVNDLIKIGEITEEEAKNHPQKNVITRAMQPCQERRAKADIAHLTDIQAGDYFYMCSDGMLEESTDENILFVITKPGITNEEKVEMLRNVTEDNKDNHTAHLIYINKVEGRTANVVPACNHVPTASPTSIIKKPMVIYGALAALLVAVAGIAVYLALPSSEKEAAEETVEEIAVPQSPTVEQTISPAPQTGNIEATKPDVPQTEISEGATPAPKENATAPEKTAPKPEVGTKPAEPKKAGRFLPTKDKKEQKPELQEETKVSKE